MQSGMTERPVPESQRRALFELADAQVVRDGRTILHVDRMVVREGEHLAVLGPNGAGKSTLIGLLTRDVRPLWRERPPVLFAGQERIELAESRRLIGVVSSAWQGVVDVHLPVRDIVVGGRFGALGVPPHLREAITSEDYAAAEVAIAELGIAELAERDMRTLSTGEARRALIARALVHDPQVVVFDEPCAGLDPTAAWQVRATMRRLAAGGRTLVLVTHHIEDIVAAIDRVMMLAEGRVIADGPKREVLTSARLGEIFGIEAEIEERGGEYRMW